jgi:hypothetical protein
MMMGMVYALALILILAGVYVVASGQQIAAGGYESQGGVNTYEDQTKSCPVAMNVQVMSTDYAKAGTGASTTSYVYDNLGNVKATSLANQTDLGVSGYKTYTFLTDGSNMFAHKYEHTFGCNGNEVVNAKVPQADTSATISFINTDGVTINAATANESVTTGQSITPTIKVKNGASYKYITSPYCTKYVITLQAANISAWDLSQTTIDGCTEISVPKVERGTAHQAFECSAPTGVIGNFQGDARAVHLALLPTGTVNGVATDDYWVFKVYPEDNVPNSITGMPMGCVAENNVGTAAQTAITSGGTYWMR